jgi:pimeloyl-ACP methyl ester carboxylesterase
MSEVAVRRRWPRNAAFGLAGLAVLVPTGTAGAGWYLATRVIDASAPREYPLEVRSYNGDRVGLTRTTDSALDVPLALVWADGYARLGGVVGGDRSTVVREVVSVQGTLRVGLRAYTSGSLYRGDPKAARGLDFDDVEVVGDLGPMPAWLVRPAPGGASGGSARSTWVIAVHGRAANRTEALRVLPTLAGLGLPTLVMSYRNDEGAPRSADRYYHLGHTEWRDVVAAVAYAQRHGATDVVLYGWSMGGATVLNAARRLSPVLRAVVLDCPVIDWLSTLYHNARGRGLPPPLAWAAVRLVERRLGVRLVELDQRKHTESVRVPTLLFLDAADASVEPEPAREYASARSDLVTLVETAGAGHTRSWNLDPGAYEAALSSFLRRVLDAPETR